MWALNSQDPSNSSAKSVDAASRNTVQSSHPFRVIDNDGLSIHSMQSLGRVGRILSGSLDPASITVKEAQKDSQTSQESPTAPVSESPPVVSEPQKAEDNQSQNSNYSVTMKPGAILQEPDVIASTKLAHSKTTDSVSRGKVEFQGSPNSLPHSR
jgi:WD repeat-containing protein 44